MIYDLPTSVTINDREYQIRSDYRAILDICTALTDPECTQREKGYILLDIFYTEFDTMPEEDYEQAIKECFDFINIGKADDNKRHPPKLMDWEQDFQYIVAPIHRVLGQEIRSIPYLHWWTFISAYFEIGDCTFAQIVRIRDQKAKGKKLDRFDADWYKEHRDIVDIKTKYTDAENELLKNWGAL